MGNWKTALDLRDVFYKRNGECGLEDWTDKTIHELSKEIARRIKRKFPQQMIDGNDWDPCLSEVYDWFVSIPTLKQHQDLVNQCMCDQDATDEEYLDLVNNTPMEDFNQCMGVFYNWCDRNSVWVDK